MTTRDDKASENGGPSNLAGMLLMAMPGIGDSRFERTVVFMCMHDDDGAMGLIVNKPSTTRVLGDLFNELSIQAPPGPSGSAVSHQPVFDGGPVETTRGFVLHDAPFGGEDGSVEVRSGIYLSTTLDILRAIAAHRGPDAYIVALGYASWSSGQLEDEIRQNAWLHTEATARSLFSTPPELHYTASLATLGVELSHLSTVAGTS